MSDMSAAPAIQWQGSSWLIRGLGGTRTFTYLAVPLAAESKPVAAGHGTRDDDEREEEQYEVHALHP